MARRAQETKKDPHASGWNHYARWADRVSDSAAAYFTKRAHTPPPRPFTAGIRTKRSTNTLHPVGDFRLLGNQLDESTTIFLNF